LTTEVVAHYRSIYREAMAAWRCSRRETPPEPVADDPATNADGSPKKKQPRLTASRPGNPALLAKAMDALKAVREIKGMDAPRQTEVAGLSGGLIQLSAVKPKDLSGMSNEQLSAFEAQLRAKCEPDLIAVEPSPPRPLPCAEEGDGQRHG